MIFSGGCQETKDQKSLFVFSFLFFKYWNKSKEKKVPYFSSWSFSQVSRKISSSLQMQVNARHSAAQCVKAGSGAKWLDGSNDMSLATLPWYKFAKSDTVKKFDKFSNVWQVHFKTFFF